MKTKIHILCQPEYFRQCIFDLLEEPNVSASWISSGDPKTVEDGLSKAYSNGTDILIVFRPEWLEPFPKLVEKLRSSGVKIVGISSEPVPFDWQKESEIHEDQLLRLKNLSSVNSVPLDFLVHYDASSKNHILRTIDHSVNFCELPLSKKLFDTFDRPPQQDFDSIFLGRSTEYRENFLVYPKMLHRHLHVAHGLTDELAAEFIKRSKVTINIHNHSYPGYEIRVMQSLMCGTPVISEPLSRDDIKVTKGLTFINSSEQLLELTLQQWAEVPCPREVFEHWRKKCNVFKWLNCILDAI